MQDIHNHLLVNHLPIIIPIIAFVIMMAGFIFNSADSKKVALGLFVFAALILLVAMRTGDAAEHALKEVKSGLGRRIHEHEEWGEKLAIMNYIIGLLSAISIWGMIKVKSWVKYPQYAVFALACVSMFFATQTGNTGGEIVHEEIRADYKPDTVGKYLLDQAEREKRKESKED